MEKNHFSIDQLEAALQTVKSSTAQAGTISAKRARNARVLEKAAWTSPEVMRVVNGMQARHGIDIRTEKNLPFKENFSFDKLREKLSLREADSESVFQQFTVAGLQTIVNNMYAVDTTTTYEDWSHIVQSKKFAEPYAPNQGPAFPRQVGENEVYPEVGAAALNISLLNYKFGTIYPVSKELLDDDQSGTFQQQAPMLGQYMKLLQEVWNYGKLASVSGMKYVDLTIPQTETKPSYETNYPWTTSAAPFRGGGFNKPASFGAPTRDNLQNARTAMMSQLNLQGIKMAVRVNRVIASPQNEYDLAIIANSSYYPSGAAAAGVTGGAFAINPLKGLFDLSISPYVFKNDGTVTGNSTAWYYCDDTKPFFVTQIREAATVTQEAINSGSSFTQDVYRFRVSSRMNADFIDPRFIWQGNDGSV